MFVCLHLNSNTVCLHLHSNAICLFTVKQLICLQLNSEELASCLGLSTGHYKVIDLPESMTSNCRPLILPTKRRLRTKTVEYMLPGNNSGDYIIPGDSTGQYVLPVQTSDQYETAGHFVEGQGDDEQFQEVVVNFELDTDRQVEQHQHQQQQQQADHHIEINNKQVILVKDANGTYSIHADKDMQSLAAYLSQHNLPGLIEQAQLLTEPGQVYSGELSQQGQMIIYEEELGQIYSETNE